ncbi:MAG: AAA family ATPase, partial [Clostridia bacterium]|nr:AAA family ATPase [Clostridia bacterium]
MLISIYIENIALIKKLSLEPDYGFCAFTGETGAGKSIIIDSLGLLCGARSDKDIIRTGEEEACVEGIFSLNEQAVKFLAEYDIEPEEDGTVTVLRKLSRDGRSVAKVNGRSIPLSRLKAVMSQLISIHGQQDTQAFADNGRQLQMLDSFAKNEALLTAYSEKYEKFRSIEQRLDSLNEDERERELRLDMLKYRVNELRSADVKVGEKEELEAERLRLANSERIVSNASEAYVTLYARDGSAIESVDNAINATSSLLGIIPEADELVSRLENAKYELIDIADTVKSYTDT